MTNPRDTGRWDMFNGEYVDTNVRVDFVWGNIPLQPNDDRGEDTLDPTLDSHIIATSGYQNFPAFVTGDPYDDTTANATVPVLSELTLEEAEAALIEAGLVLGEVTYDEDNANSENDGYVASQETTDGTVLNAGAEVNLTVFRLVGTAIPNIAGMGWVQAHAELTGAGFVLGTETYSSTGATESNVNLVKNTSPAIGTLQPAGSTVNIVYYEFLGYNIAGIRYESTLDGGAGGYYLFITGRTNQPTVGNPIYINDSGQDVDGAHTVLAVANDDSFNTGGTKISIDKGSSTYTGAQIIGSGLWSRTNIW